jgi:hypothetical protein
LSRNADPLDPLLTASSFLPDRWRISPSVGAVSSGLSARSAASRFALPPVSSALAGLAFGI